MISVDCDVLLHLLCICARVAELAIMATFLPMLDNEAMGRKRCGNNGVSICKSDLKYWGNFAQLNVSGW